MDNLKGADGPLRELALFAGAGGGILGGKLLGWETICAVECDPYAAAVLCQRQNDGVLPPFAIWDNVCTFDGRPWRGIVDVVSGGFPCQDISTAGRGAGIDGERSGLWREMARIIGEVRPRFVFVENSPAITNRGLSRVLGDLAALGFDAKWGVVSAQDAIFLAGDPCLYHERERIWIVGENTNSRCKHGQQRNTGKLETYEAKWSTSAIHNKSIFKGLDKNNWKTQPQLVRMANGVAHKLDRLRAIGNGQVPAVAALAWRILTQ